MGVEEGIIKQYGSASSTYGPSGTTEVAQLRREAKAVMEIFAHDHARLYDRRGFSKFTREEHQARVKDLEVERRADLEAIEERCREIYLHADKEAERASEIVPTSVLSVTEVLTASTQQPLVDADVASLSEAELERRLEAVVRSSTKTESFTYLQAARKRRREILSAKAKALREQTGRPATSAEASATGFDSALGALEEKVLGEETSRPREHYTELRDAAGKVGELAFAGKYGARSIQGVYFKRRYPHIVEFAERQKREGYLAPRV